MGYLLCRNREKGVPDPLNCAVLSRMVPVCVCQSAAVTLRIKCTVWTSVNFNSIPLIYAILDTEIFAYITVQFQTIKMPLFFKRNFQVQILELMLCNTRVLASNADYCNIYIEFACSPCACVGFSWVLRFLNIPKTFW